ncbi:hypothetical protein FQN54_006618 [Arachnomyces sp. PD_36]|nr:hypothetical protein FQN54_006618 [Arachnomyces sp. PD_36]
MASSTGDEPGESGYPMDFMKPLRFGNFCNTCNNFDLHSFGRDPFGLRGYKYSDAEEAASKGCPFCSVLVGAFKDKLRSSAQTLPTGWEKWWWIHLSLGATGGPASQDIESRGSGLGIYAMRATLAFQNYDYPTSDVRMPKLPWGRTFQLLDFHVAADSDSQAASSGDIQGRYTGEVALSEDSIRMINNWLQTCLWHPKCCQTMSGERSINARRAPLPTRCVEILTDGFRIKETSSEIGTYITLSHRWTSETPLCYTTAGNIDSRRHIHGNWWQHLPKTFLDVLELARQLNVQYVWIDSLCIIQSGDEGVDWRRESIKMADYYQHSMLTIAATSGSKDLGLVPPKIIVPPRIARLPYRDSNGSRHGYFYVYSYSWEVDKQYLSFVQDSELLSRGWVFQEWLLSRRIVYFTPAGIFRECEEKPPYNDRGEISQTLSEDGKPADVQPSAKHSFTLGAATINPVWYRIIEVYSALSLTEPGADRIVALAGVAKEFREALMRKESAKNNPVAATVPSGLESVSGLWLPDLHRGLLWQRKSSECKLRRIPNFPTWSWTSIPCAVEWNDGLGSRIDPQAGLIAVGTSEDDVFSVNSLQPVKGSISSPPKVFDVDNKFAFLCMKGTTLQVVLRDQFKSERDLEITSTASGYAGKSDKTSWRPVCSSLLPTEIAGWASFDYQDDSLSSGDGHELCALLISKASGVPGGYGLGFLTAWHNVFNVLFIKNIDGQKYERLGVGRLFGKEIEKQVGMARSSFVELK